MKNIFFISFFIVFKCYSQNLVPNQSFEIVDTCYDLGNGFAYGDVAPWDTPSSGSSDAFNTCVVTQTTAVPANNFGYQNPHSGNGYGGAGFYDNSLNNYREYIQVQLDTPLIDHQQYCISFYVNHSNRSQFAVNNIGMYISDSHTYIPGGAPLPYIPQINYTNVISDDSLWIEIYGQYISHGGEKYIIIGNFFSDSLTDTTHVHGSGTTLGSAYYYIDDVNVHCCTCDSTTSLHNEVGEIKEEEMEIYPNPAVGVDIELAYSVIKPGDAAPATSLQCINHQVVSDARFILSLGETAVGMQIVLFARYVYVKHPKLSGAFGVAKTAVVS